MAETHYDLELLKTELLNRFDSEESEEAISLLINWFRQLVEHNCLEKIDYEALEQVYHSKSEAKQVLETMIAQERERIFAQGEAQGRARGKAEGEAEGWVRGKAEGQAEFLVVMLETRFGSLNQRQTEYIYTLDATRLLALAEKLWRIESWSEIFLESDEDK